MALGSTSAFATNGDHLIGLGAKARGMGGTGIGISHGAESALANPAMITSVKNSEISFGGTLFMPDVATNLGAGAPKSDADMSMIPEVSLATKINDNLYVGVGMWGTAGMGVDYREQSGFTANMKMVTNLQLMQFGVPVAYKMNNFSIGFTPIMQYGALDIQYDSTGFPSGGPKGAGVAQDFGYGYNLGAAFEMDGLTIGATYKSAIDMEYKGQLSGATQYFASGFGFNGGQALEDHLEQPAEMGAGVSYKMNEHTIAFDYKKIKWSDAKGYKKFGWEDQSVYALGYQFDAGKWQARAGYNYAKSPIKEQNGATVDGAIYNLFNLLGFPATVEKHYTIGGTYELSDSASLDLAYAYAPEVTDTFGLAAFTAYSITSIKTTHSQDSLSFQLNFKF
jgi:long-chain fatty acid transport protein